MPTQIVLPIQLIHTCLLLILQKQQHKNRYGTPEIAKAIAMTTNQTSASINNYRVYGAVIYEWATFVQGLT